MTEVDGWIYAYEPLKHDDSFRVVELLPKSAFSTLTCRLVEARRSHHPDYEALSYAWGGPIFSATIIEHTTQTVLRITETLSEALHVLRYDNEVRTLWIDALCINQADIDEKGHQVGKMAEVYKGATMVNVWLGSEDVTEELEIMRKIDDNARQLWSSLEGVSGSERAIKIQRSILRLQEYLEEDAIFRFLSRPWFTRLWTVQEFVLARQVRVYVGHYYGELDAFFNVMQSFQIGSYSHILGRRIAKVSI